MIELSEQELLDVFHYFDKGETQNISYKQFINVLWEQHLDLNGIYKKIQDYMFK